MLLSVFKVIITICISSMEVYEHILMAFTVELVPFLPFYRIGNKERKYHVKVQPVETKNNTKSHIIKSSLARSC